MFDGDPNSLKQHLYRNKIVKLSSKSQTNEIILGLVALCSTKIHCFPKSITNLIL